MEGILILLIVAIIVIFALGIYVAVTLGLVTFSLMLFFSDRPLWEIIGTMAWNVNTNVTLVAVPLFILMGEILLRSGITESMYEVLAKWLNFLPGGLLHTNVVACGVFAAISGSSVATAATISSVALPNFRARGYNERLAVGSLAAGGTVGILIPPSVVLIVYGVLVEESIGRLYIAGILPGILMIVLFMAAIFIIAKLKPDTAPREAGVSWRERLLSLWRLLPIVILIFLVLGTIYVGIATPTEAAAFGTTGAFVICLINKRVTREMLRETFLATASTTAMVLLIMISAFLLQFTLAHLGLPAALARAVTEMNLSPVQFVLMVCVLYLFLGCFMESFSMIVTTVPVLLPLLNALNIDLIWMGIIMVILVEAALITPPVGMNLFVLHGLRKRLQGAKGTETISEVYIGVLPFLLAMLLTLALVIAFPELSLWLPTTMKG